MSVTVNDSLIGPSRITAKQVRAWYVGTFGRPVPTAVSDYLNELERLCALVGFDMLLLSAQSSHETASWQSMWWLNRINPAGIGIPGDPDQNDDSQIWRNGTDAARGHVVHMVAYVYGLPGHPAISLINGFENRAAWYDNRLNHALEQPWAGTIRTLNDLTGRWAVATDYAPQIAARANEMIRGMEVDPVAELRVILNPGHRNTSGGNPDEAAFTPKLAAAYFNAFSTAGYEAVNLGDTSDGLDETCRRMAAQIASAPGECVLLDLHLEGGGPPGAFAIIPDVTGLTTNAPVPQDPDDTWENNSRDRTLGSEIVRQIMGATGLAPRVSGVRSVGLMDESQTGVGGQGYRLATFAYTSPYRAKAVRLVIEHGCHTTEPDRSIIFAPGFAEKCAAAAVAAVRAVYGVPGTTPPGPVYATTVVPEWFAASVKQAHPSDANVDGVRWFVLRRNFEALKNTNRYSRPDTSSPKSGPKILTREKIVCERYFKDANKRSWIVEPDGSYVTAASLTPAVTIRSR